MENRKAYSYIRFSTPEQLKGDSLQRQLDASDKYCKENDLILDESLRLKDLGVSAFKGTHKKRGALGVFLRLVEQGKIPEGSVLIVENFDRLSREEILTALNQFTNIIQAGIKVVTLSDGMEYSKESITDNWAQLIISITYMARAHDESKMKSERLKSAWLTKRKNISSENRKMTKRAPTWLKLNDDKTEYILIPEICKAIETIYRMKLAGKGSETIVKELNQNDDIWKPAPSKRSKLGGWRKSYVNKILFNNRALLGEFQPHKMIDGKRVPVGDPIPDYFPKAIDEKLFKQVQNVVEINRLSSGHGGGKTGKIRNLFTHIARCGYCGGPLHYKSKGEFSYLVCDNSSRRLKKPDNSDELICTAKNVSYSEFEQLFFNDFDEFNIHDFLPGKDERQTEINNLEKEISVGLYNFRDMEKQMENLLQSIRKTSDEEIRAIYEQELVKVKDEKAAIYRQIELDRIQLEKLRQNGKELERNINSAKEIYSLLDSVKDEDEMIDLRFRLRAQIRNICNLIEVYPLKEPYKAKKEIEPGIIQIMNSKRIDKVRIRFNGSKKKRVIYRKTFIDTNSVKH